MSAQSSESQERSNCGQVGERYQPCFAAGLSAKLTIVIGDTQFSEEKTLLVRSCDYFQALYRSGMKECQQEKIHLQCVRARGFFIALAVVRGEMPAMDEEDIVDAIECAAFLQVTALTKHLINLLDGENCLLMFHTAATFGLMDLYHAAALFIRDTYGDLKAEVQTALSSELVTYIESLPPSVFVAVGAHVSCAEDNSVHAASRTVCYLDETGNNWNVLTELPLEASTSMAGVTVLDNKLYIVGGVHGPDKEVVESCFCFNVEDNSWTRINSPAQLRYNLSLVGVDSCLYAIGGECERTVMSSVEVYNVKSGGWTFAAHLPRPAAGAACTTTMSRIFVCLWKPMETTEIYEYVPNRDEWHLITTLIRHQSYGHCLVGHRDNLYVMRNGPSDDFLRCLMDCYNLSSGQWSALPGHFTNSKGSLFTAVVRGDSAFTLNRSMTLEYKVDGRNWKPRRQMKGFPRSGSVWTFLLRLPA
ncbi:kelch repeat and BTB domain-containing protein 13 [Nothobranchius furzeri]|uniref:Kelch repeat and BTB domain containing 13b n=1 Tax=Nothobranchius furzeri TaxID=105023 RepID=A0A8C6MHZ6_NOTFU|nr:kelch repeat and BTB domain-containing protein 13 [Nothobranchius furzeri]KAF7214652.1 kelch repeat and BTB domain-containing protein 13-like [Nothobranchius furzeri]